MNIVLHIAYDGGCYLGWQKTPNGPTVEGALEQCLTTLLNHPVKLQAASRTDAGVHAKGQVVNFFTNKDIDLGELELGLKRLLPKDIYLLTVLQAPDHFHPTLDCKQKTYIYTVQTKPLSPFDRHYIWHYPYPIHLDLVRQNAKELVGIHDFKAFETISSSMSKSTEREIFSITLDEIKPSRFEIQVCGNNFLYKMVRTLVGTLVQIGSQKLDRDMLSILRSLDRKQAGVTAPAHALYLSKVIYEEPVLKNLE